MLVDMKQLAQDIQNFKKELKVATSSKFSKKMKNYSEERRAQEADEKRKLDYLKVMDKLDNER